MNVYAVLFYILLCGWAFALGAAARLCWIHRPRNFAPCMKFDPAWGQENPHPSNHVIWRGAHPEAIWRFNPWTGVYRNPSDVHSDPQGYCITPPGMVVKASAK